ncbi:MAG: LexA family transcriptional repressor [SAR324 cluster bacterium]|nr:LexA family transcriptional repressor [SAR324 cluster bacterium]
MLNDFPRRFEFIIENTEVSKTKFAKSTGKTPAQITDICKGRGKPTFKYLLALNVKYGINVNWLLTGEGAPFLEESARYVLEDEEMMAQFGSRGESSSAQFANNFVMVPRYDVQASAGYGAIINSEQVVDYLAFKKEWVQNNLRAEAPDLALITADGDSMEPTIKNGDLLLVDLSETRVKKDSIYILRLEDLLIAKRLQSMYDGSLLIRSDNVAYKEQIVQKEALENLQVLGRVIWFGRRM